MLYWERPNPTESGNTSKVSFLRQGKNQKEVSAMKKKSTNQNSGLWTASYGEIGATLKALQDHGVTLKHLARLRAEPEYAKRVAKYIVRDDINGSISHEFARAIMGNN